MKKSNKITKRSTKQESDSTYLLKIVLYLIIGSQWVRLSFGQNELSLPVGFLIGLLFSRHDHFQIDRKIEYAVLLMAVFIGFWIPMGLNIIIS